ncbi:MAG: hypothetical protein NZ988_04465 [Thaumarchaeota archaeon]|nr:hypothetical protein [Candidatus Calditenuaceae archaeon]MDW8187281.1 hypothetical protein [Nitrososphaerota archaeon]
MAIAQLPFGALDLTLVLLGLLLVLLGRKVLKLAAFLATGALGALLIRNLLLGRLSPFLLDVATLLSFVGLGLVGLLILRVGAGLATALIAYFITTSVGAGFAIALLVALMAFVVGFTFHDLLLAIASASVGGYLVYVGLLGLGAASQTAVLIAGALIAGGILLQSRR